MELKYVKCHRGDFLLDIPLLRIGKTQKVAILGENGCGKTTLIQLMCGLLPPDSGTVHLPCCNVYRVTARKRAKHMAYLPQEAGLLFDLPVRDVIELVNPDEQEPLDGRILKALDLQDMLDRRYQKLSGGEKRRVMIARVMNLRRTFTFLDEPSASLDMRRAWMAMKYISSTENAVITAIHDINSALLYFERFLLMKEGRIIFDLTKDEVDEHALSEVYSMPVRRCDDHFVLAV